MEINRTSVVAGTPDHIAALLTNYQCGHCDSTTSIAIQGPETALTVHHDDNCPVLTGTLTAAHDIARAATT
ncbi:hypothetical protein ACIQUL_09030 [Streptomyces sp. NPDC090303]|uniref:hypothetical protein n=1 Tax=Streptomyces sp. NPDC090303 TaxID=3365960 RepID=UPI00380FD9A0